MLGLMIFDHLNDVIFFHSNNEFARHVRGLAISNGLLENCEAVTEEDGSSKINSPEDCTIDPNVIIQIFSPLIASQTIMEAQFGNSYESIECKDGTLLIFKKYMDFIFLCIGKRPESFLERYINICILLVKITVGPSVRLLKRNFGKTQLLSGLLSKWQQLFPADQSYLVEALDRVVVDSEISTCATKALSGAVDQMKKCKDLSSGHSLFFVRNKLLAMQSSPHAQELTSADMLLLNLLLETYRSKSWSSSLNETFIGETSHKDTQDEVIEESCESTCDEKENEESKNDYGFPGSIFTQILFLRNKRVPLCPHLVFLLPLSNNISLIMVFEMNRSQISGELINFLSLVDSLKINLERHKGSTAVVLDSIDSCLRKAQEYTQWLPKDVQAKIQREVSKVNIRWDNFKKSALNDWLRSSEKMEELPSHLEGSLSTIKESTIEAWEYACFLFDLSCSFSHVQDACRKVREAMAGYLPLLEPNASKDLSLPSSSILTINKYMEDFPGLVHFLYIDRNQHSLTAPMLYCSRESQDVTDSVGLTERVTVSKVWSMIELARENLTKGHVSLLWKDKTFSYSYFLWFEDSSGNSLLAEPIKKVDVASLPQPGILSDDYYRSFVSLAFPGMDPSKVRVYEMFCIHLGLATSPCILEQTRRLAATVWEISGGMMSNAGDIFS